MENGKGIQLVFLRCNVKGGFIIMVRPIKSRLKQYLSFGYVDDVLMKTPF